MGASAPYSGRDTPGRCRVVRTPACVRAPGVVAIALALCSCARTAVLDPAGPVAAANRTILLNALTIMLAIVVPTMIAAIAFAWWFRAGNTRARYRPEFVYSGRIEMVVWSIPLLVILFLGGVIWIGSHALDPYRPLPSRTRPIEVQVVSLDWKWLFIYPDAGIASVNALVVPVGVPVHFTLTSATVMNAFFVPRLGSMIYTMNGMATQLHLQADTPGIYHGQSAMFSGDGFADMHFPVRAVPPADYAAWVARVRGHAVPLDRAAYARLGRPGVGTPQLFGAVQPGLFDAIVREHMPAAPRPMPGRAGGDPAISPKPEVGHVR
jgi:cytochrome o ubiquinol oxidase subunit 2